MSTEKELFDLIYEMYGYDNEKIGIHENDMEEGYRVYHADGYAFDIGREYICEPEDTDDFIGVDYDGYAYEFSDWMDGFKDINVKQAINLLHHGNI